MNSFVKSFYLIFVLFSCTITPTAESFYQKGSVNLDLNDYYGAIADFTKAIDINQEYALAYCGRGIAKHKLKDEQGAISDLDISISLDTKNFEAFFIEVWQKEKYSTLKNLLQISQKQSNWLLLMS